MSPFPTMFSKDFYCTHVKTRLVWERVKKMKKEETAISHHFYVFRYVFFELLVALWTVLQSGFLKKGQKHIERRLQNTPFPQNSWFSTVLNIMYVYLKIFAGLWTALQFSFLVKGQMHLKKKKRFLNNSFSSKC